MKFQDDISNMNTYIHTYIHTYIRTDKPKPICPPPLFQSWGHKNFEELETPMLHTKFQNHRSFSSGEEDF